MTGCRLEETRPSQGSPLLGWGHSCGDHALALAYNEVKKATLIEGRVSDGEEREAHVQNAGHQVPQPPKEAPERQNPGAAGEEEVRTAAVKGLPLSRLFFDGRIDRHAMIFERAAAGRESVR